jgi:hypothetical protein
MRVILNVASTLVLICAVAPLAAAAAGADILEQRTSSQLHRDATQADAVTEDFRDIHTTDRFVPHVSTVPANRGAAVNLFVREKVRADDDRQRPVVLMIGGAATSPVEVSICPSRTTVG